jgi:hypothetical protein
MAINLDHVTEQITVTDTAANASLTVNPKGTGAFNIAAGSGGLNLSNGGTVTNITLTNNGGGSGGYTSFPSLLISAPTTAGGVQATATILVMQPITASVQSGGTGYTLNDVVSLVGGTPQTVAATFRVSAVSGGVVTAVVAVNFAPYSVLPTAPVSTTGGTGTGLTLTSLAYAVGGTFTITNAGSGYVEQPTITFSGGGGSGATAYAGIGGIATIKALAANVASLQLATAGGVAFSVADTNRPTVDYWEAIGSTGAVGLRVAGATTNNNGIITSKGTGYLSLQTNAFGSESLRAGHTASAVNFIQSNGQPAGFGPLLSSQGSDTNINMVYMSKGTGSHAFGTGGASYTQQLSVAHTASAVNYHQLTGSATGFGVVHSAQGTDTNIPLVLQPKGTGALQANQTDSTATGGNARGANAVDWQTNRNAGAQVASQPYSVIGGGTTNTANGFGSAVVGGTSNTSSNNYSFVGAGALNAASGIQSSVVGGWANTASGYFGFVGNGFTNSTTSNSAVTTQSSTMNGTTAVTLAASNANIKVGQYITGTSIAADTYVAAISGTSLTLSKVASGSSTSTLSFYTPHGVVVGGGNNTATGSYSFIGGGGDAGTAGNRNVASGDWSVVGGGTKNVASGVGSVIAGGGFEFSFNFGNTASGNSSFVGGGILNVASGTGSSIISGWQNTSNGTLSNIIGGRFGFARAITGNTVIPANNDAMAGGALGTMQTATLALGKQTTDATATRLTSDNSAAGTTNQVIMPNNSAYFFTGEVVAGVTGGGNTKGWTIEGVIKRGANAASTALVGTPTVTSTYADAGASTWVIAVTADTTNGGLAVTFTGQASTTIRTVARINSVEMTF